MYTNFSVLGYMQLQRDDLPLPMPLVLKNAFNFNKVQYSSTVELWYHQACQAKEVSHPYCQSFQEDNFYPVELPDPRSMNEDTFGIKCL